jgi:hypothetical protein
MSQQREWIKSSRSGSGNENCVELSLDAGQVRDSKNPGGPMLAVDLTRFLDAVKAESFGSGADR